MKHQKRLFNELLRRYNKYRNRLNNLQQTGRNQRRQSILQKHIERIYIKLSSFWVSLQKPAVVTSIALSAIAFLPQEPNAQTFGAPQTNPFSLNSTSTSFSTASMVDIDGDGDFDMIAGDYSGGFRYFANIGTPNSPIFSSNITNPFSLTGVGLFSSHGFVDLDGDGDFDVLSGEYYGTFIYHENTGTVNAPAFAAPQTNPFSLTDIGFISSPTFADLDGDGDFDMLSGSYGSGSFHYFENTGTVNTPSFAAVQTNPFSLTNVSFISHPHFADIDGDGDFDILVGEYPNGNFFYFENTGTVNAPSFSAVQSNPFSLSPLGNFSSPFLVDIDGDGDRDLMSGRMDASFSYFENESPAPEILVKGNSIEIVSGDTIPSASDSTDFGGFCVNTSQYRTYTIVNESVSDTLIVDPNIVVGGVNASDFLVTSQPSGTILPSDSSSFTVQFTPSLFGLRKATLTINNNDNNESVYLIGVQGTGTHPDATITNASPTLTANATGATYQWLDCDNNFAIISGEINQSFTATANGNYAVVITDNGCTDTSECEAVANVGMIESTLAKNLKVFPNPTNGQVNIDFSGVSTSATITIINYLGQIINQEVITSANKAILTIKGKQGIYFIEITTDRGYQQRMKVIKE